MKLTYFIYLQITTCRLIKHFTVIYADANKQFLTLNLIFFAAKKSPYLGPQSPTQKLQISLFEPKKISHVCNIPAYRSVSTEQQHTWPSILVDWPTCILAYLCQLTDWPTYMTIYPVWLTEHTWLSLYSAWLTKNTSACLFGLTEQAAYRPILPGFLN